MGFSEDDQQTDLIIYPNPGFSSITVSGYDGLARIYNVQGRKVWEGTIRQGEKIDVSGFSRGMYVLKAHNMIRKFTVESSSSF